MSVSHSTFENIRKLARDEKIGPILDLMGNKKPPIEMLTKLADAFSEDIHVVPDKRDAIILLLEMAYWAGIADGKTPTDQK